MLVDPKTSRYPLFNRHVIEEHAPEAAPAGLRGVYRRSFTAQATAADGATSVRYLHAFDAAYPPLSALDAQGRRNATDDATLRPIRDLAKNWNIDVASELEDYMEELEDIKVSFDDGETELNFAEGAYAAAAAATAAAAAELNRLM